MATSQEGGKLARTDCLMQFSSGAFGKKCSRMQMDVLACQKIKKSNGQLFDIMGAGRLFEIFTARRHSKELP